MQTNKQTNKQTKGKSLTIVSVTGHQGYAQGSAYAIARSYEQLQGKIADLKCLLISPERPEELADYILHCPCKPFSYFEYNIFMLYSLGQLIETDFVLVVQNDGWVLNGNNWRDEFFEYDYLGAPVPFLQEPQADGSVKTYPREYWAEVYQNLPPNLYEVQNGGFSLRSKRLLDAPREFNLKMNLFSPDLFTEIPVSMKLTSTPVEDTFITVLNRHFLEEKGFKFAPRELAAYFSFEHTLIHNTLDIDHSKIFGCHFNGAFKLIEKNKAFCYQRFCLNVEQLKESYVFQLMINSGLELSFPKQFFDDL